MEIRIKGATDRSLKNMTEVHLNEHTVIFKAGKCAPFKLDYLLLLTAGIVCLWLESSIGWPEMGWSSSNEPLLLFYKYLQRSEI